MFVEQIFIATRSQCSFSRNADKQVAVGHGNCVDGEAHREERTVLVPRACVERARPRCLGDDFVQIVADDITRGMAKHAFRRRVERAHHAVLIEGDDRVRDDSHVL